MSPDEGCHKAVEMYRILAALLAPLGAGLLACGILAVKNKEENDVGMPYFLGGFIVGILTLISAGLCTCIFQKAPNADDEIKKRKIGCLMQGQYALSMLTFVGCFVGFISAGQGGFSSFGIKRFDEEDEDIKSIKKTLSIAIIVGCIIAVFVTVFAIYTFLRYCSYFGVIIRSRRQVVIMNAVGSTMPTAFNATTFQMNTFNNNDQISQLEAQNRLLHQQLVLQRQLQQQQQQQQTGYSSGFNSQPPPPAFGLRHNAHHPTVPPPSYNNVK